MKRVAFTILIIAIILGGGWLTFRDPGPIRHFDANLKPLAENYPEGYCVGNYFLKTNGEENNPTVTDCVNQLETMQPDILQAIPGFCQAVINSGWTGSRNQCEEIFEEAGLWPLLYGGVTSEWNSGHPRPSLPAGNITKPRGGARPDYERSFGG
jgi:hypothetical protein